MSRIGNRVIPISGKVKVEIDGQHVCVTGPKATLKHVLPDLISVEHVASELYVKRADESRSARSLHGLSRTLLANMIQGAADGFKKELDIQGVGYRAQVQGSNLTLHLGYSHPVEFAVPAGITVTVTNNTRVAVEGADKQQVGQVAATIREFRKPEPYKGKGIRYLGGYVAQKEGKTV